MSLPNLNEARVAAASRIVASLIEKSKFDLQGLEQPKAQMLIARRAVQIADYVIQYVVGEPLGSLK